MAYVAVLERPLGPQGDFDGLFAVVAASLAVGERYVRDPKDDFGLGGVGTAVSRTTALGRSTLGRESGDRPVHAKSRARERPGLLVLSPGFATAYAMLNACSDRERASGIATIC